MVLCLTREVSEPESDTDDSDVEPTMEVAMEVSIEKEIQEDMRTSKEDEGMAFFDAGLDTCAQCKISSN